MWQRKTIDIFNVATILLLLSVFVIHPNTGLSNNISSSQANLSIAGDISVDEIYNPKGKMKLALQHPYPTKQKEQPQKPKVITEVSSITSYKPTPAPIPTPTEDINSLIQKYADQYGVDANIMKIIANCESGFRQEAVNGNFGGMYQFLASTWSSNRKAMGLDPNPNLRFNGEEAIKTAAFKMGRDGYGAWPSCSQKAFTLLAQQ